MLADLPLPPSLMALLACFEPLFTVPSFRTFCALAAGFLAQTGRRTVCGMLTGAGLAGVWRHDRAHWFFSHARWEPHALGLTLARLVVALLVPGRWFGKGAEALGSHDVGGSSPFPDCPASPGTRRGRCSSPSAVAFGHP